MAKLSQKESKFLVEENVLVVLVSLLTSVDRLTPEVLSSRLCPC